MKCGFLRLIVTCSVFIPTLTHAQAFVDNPQPESIQSGIGALFGWKCTAGAMTARFDGGDPIPIVYGSTRGDTLPICGDDDNGFVLLWNWGLLGDGTHTVELFDNGVQFASVTFTVVTTGMEFLTGAEAICTIPDFPSSDQVATVEWSESIQNFTLTERGFFPSAIPDVRGTWFMDLTFSSEDCNFLTVPPDLPMEVSGTLLVLQFSTSLVAVSGSVSLSGSLQANGEFVLVSDVEEDVVDSCLIGTTAGFSGNFLEESLVFVLIWTQLSGTCTGLSLPCSAQYEGTLTLLEESASAESKGNLLQRLFNLKQQ